MKTPQTRGWGVFGEMVVGGDHSMTAAKIPELPPTSNLPTTEFNLCAMRELARVVLRDRESSPVVTALLARCLLYVLQGVR